MEIQREAAIEVVGTQYNNRAINHRGLKIRQKLVLEHQENNTYDKNAVAVLTIDGRQLGFLPKGYASLYAPAIDSGRYTLNVEVEKTEADSERPILIVNIIAESKVNSEEDVEKKIYLFTSNIISGYNLQKTEYLDYIKREAVNADSLIDLLNNLRLTYSLLTITNEYERISSIENNTEKHSPYNIDSLLLQVTALQEDIKDVLKKLQKQYNESLDIDDEDEYQKVQKKIREKRKKFRRYSELFESYHDAIDGFTEVYVAAQTDSESIVKHEITVETTAEPASVEKKEELFLTEAEFTNWLVKQSYKSALRRRYVADIHSIENLYRTVFGDKKLILDAPSRSSAKEVIDTVIANKSYKEANDRRLGNFNKSLSLFAEYANISIEGLVDKTKLGYNQTQIAKEPNTLNTVDFERPDDYKTIKPCSFMLNKQRYSVDSWHELYAKFLILLYTDRLYSKVMNGLIGKALYGVEIDFADKALLDKLRKPISISIGFFAEGDLSAVDTIKHIKCLMEECSINKENMIIEYSMNDIEYEAAFSGEESENAEDKEQSAENETVISDKLNEGTEVNTLVVNGKSNLPDSNYSFDTSSFIPDKTKSFELKDALVEILSSDASSIINYREHKNGISSGSLRNIIKEYYGKTIGLFEISKLLMTDKAFRSVGRGCYIYDPDLATESEESDISVMEDMYVPENNTAAADSVADFNDTSIDDKTENDISIDVILELIRQTSDNLQYADGFGAYEVKMLLANRGIENASEEKIEVLMSECPDLRKTDDGYYMLLNGNNAEVIDNKSTVDVDHSDENGSEELITTNRDSDEQMMTETADRHIVLKLYRSLVRAYDYSDALIKICEFAINYKPFRMARIAGHGLSVNGKSVFYRKAVPVDGYKKLSNGLQVISINSLEDLQTVTNDIIEHCDIDDDMIKIISK